MIRFSLPTTEEIAVLGQPQTAAVSVYLATSPTPAGRERAATAAKSAIDESLRRLREVGAGSDDLAAIRAEWERLVGETSLWGGLSNSLAIFLSPTVSEEYVLPNQLEDLQYAGGHFILGPLLRAISVPQRAFALTLSANGWNLWQATATSRAAELPLAGEYAEDAADATNRMTIRGRKLLGRLGGDEGHKILLERYAQVVADAVKKELAAVDPHAAHPLFVFANEPLLGMFAAQGLARQQVGVPGAVDELRPDQIDDVIRPRLAALYSERVSNLANRIGNGFTEGLAAADTAQIARAAVAGAVETFIFDFTQRVPGSIDEASGEIRREPGAGDLHDRLALLVLRQGGTVLPVRPGEVQASIWAGTTLAGLRYRLA